MPGALWTSTRCARRSRRTSHASHGGAEPLYREVLEMRQRLFPGDHRDVAGSLVILAYCLDDLDRLSEALDRAQRAADMADRILPEAHPIRKRCDDTLVEIRKKMEDKAGGPAAPKGSHHRAAPLHAERGSRLRRPFPRAPGRSLPVRTSRPPGWRGTAHARGR